MVAQASDDLADDPHGALIASGIDQVTLAPVNHRGHKLLYKIEEPAPPVSRTMRYSVKAVARRVAKLDPQQRAELLNHVSTTTLSVYDRLDNDAEGRVVRNASWFALKGLVDGAARK